MVRIEEVRGVDRRPQSGARNAMDRQRRSVRLSGEFDANDSASVAAREGGAFCAGWGISNSPVRCPIATPFNVMSSMAWHFPRANPAPRGPLGPTRLELSKPVIAAVEGRPWPAAWSLRCGAISAAHGPRAPISASIAGVGASRCWTVGSAPSGASGRPGPRDGNHSDGRKVPADEALRIGMCEQVVEPRRARRGRSDGARDRAVSSSGGTGRSALGGENYGLPVREALW